MNIIFKTKFGTILSWTRLSYGIDNSIRNDTFKNDQVYHSTMSKGIVSNPYNIVKGNLNSPYIYTRNVERTSNDGDFIEPTWTLPNRSAPAVNVKDTEQTFQRWWAILPVRSVDEFIESSLQSNTFLDNSTPLIGLINNSGEYLNFPRTLTWNEHIYCGFQAVGQYGNIRWVGEGHITWAIVEGIFDPFVYYTYYDNNENIWKYNFQGGFRFKDVSDGYSQEYIETCYKTTL